LAVCTAQSGCRETSCYQARCGTQIAACLGTAPTVATAPPTPSAPPPSGAAVPHYTAYTGITRAQLSGNFTVRLYVLFDDGTALGQMPATGLDGLDRSSIANELGSYR